MANSKADTFYGANGGTPGKSIQDLMYEKYLAQKSALPTLRQTSADFQNAAKSGKVEWFDGSRPT